MSALPRWKGIVAPSVSCLLLLWQFTIFTPPVTAQSTPSILISEFRTRGPGGANDEFIELYNNTDSDVNIGGWKINGSNSAGATSTRVTIAAGIMLPARRHFLVTHSGAYSGVLRGNQTYGAGVADNGGLALLTPANIIVDQIGLSAGSAYRKGATLAPLTTNVNRSYERRPGGGFGSTQNTGSNAVDFFIISPSEAQNLNSSPTPGGKVNLSLNHVTVNEGSSSSGGQTTARFTVSLSGPAPLGGVTFDIATADNTATVADSDYLPQSLTAQSIPAGSSTYSFDVFVIGDAKAESNETFFVNVTNISGLYGASAGDAQEEGGLGTIANDDFTIIPIHDIQGTGSASPLVGAIVTTTGVVTGRKSNGFFIQTPDADIDADSVTSQGVFVFTSGAPPAAAKLRNLVNVTGRVIEFTSNADPDSPPLTEISGSLSINLISTGNALPTAVTITSTDTNPAGSIEQLEKYEGMRVRVDSLTVVSPTGGFVNETNAAATSNGIFYGVLTGLARPLREPGIEVPDPLPAGAPANVPRFDANPERLRVDSDAQPGAVALNVTSGAVITNLVGPLDYGFRSYTILSDPATATPPGPKASGITSAVPIPAPTSNELIIGSFNLERFFDTVNAPGVDDPVLTPAAFSKRLNKASLAIRNVLQTPDVLGAIEFENLSALQALADKINADAVAAGVANPSYQAYLIEGNDIGGIDVGFLVKSSRVHVIEVRQEGKDATYLNPGNNQPDVLNDRPPLLLRASIQSTSGEAVAFTVIVNHLRSLNGADGDTANARRVRAKRRAQAEFLANLIQSRQAADPSERIASVGDYNAFQFNDGLVDVIGTIKGEPTPADQVVLAATDLVHPNLFNASQIAPASDNYSFIFDGNAQTLDHILVSESFRPNLSRFAHAHLNADFPEVFRNDALRPERISDHDALVAYFTLAANVSTNVSVSRSGLIYSRATRTFNGTLIITNTTAEKISGPLQVVFDNLVSGIDVSNRSGTFQGQAFVSIPISTLAPGAQTSVAVRFTNPGFTQINYTPLVFSGQF